MEKRKKNRGWKWLAGIASVLILLFVAVQVFVRFYLDDVIRSLAQERVSEASDKKYSLEAGKISFNLLTGNIRIRDIKIVPDTAVIHATRLKGDSVSMIYYVTSPSLSIGRLDISKIWHKESLDAVSLLLDKPQIRILKNIRWKKAKDTSEAMGFDFDKLIPKDFSGIFVKRLNVSDASVEIRNEDTPEKQALNIDHLYIGMQGIAIRKRKAGEQVNAPVAKHMDVALKNYMMRLPDSLHVLKIASISVNGENVKMTDVSISPDSLKLSKGTQKVAAIRFRSPEINVDSIDLYNAFWQNQLEIHNLDIEKAKIDVGKPTERKNRAMQFDIVKLMPKNIISMNIHRLQMNNASMSFYINSGGKEQRISLRPVYATIRRFYFDTLSLSRDKRFLFSDEVQLQTGNIDFHLPNSIYRLNVGAIYLNSAGGRMKLGNIDLVPEISKEALGQKLGHEEDWIKLSIADISVSGLRMQAFSNGSFIADKAVVSRLDIYDFRDKRLADKHNYVPMPQEMLKKLDFPLSIQQLVFRNSAVTYEEFSDHGKAPGHVKFSNINASLAHVSNMTTGAPMSFEGRAKLYGQGNVYAKAVLPMSSEGNFTISGSIEGISFTAFNSMIGPSLGIRIKAGYIDRMLFDLQGNKDVANGNMKMYYKDFQLAILDKETGSEGGLKQQLSSFIANKLVLQSDNPKKDQPLRPGSIHFERNKERAFTNYVWNCAMSGILSSIGAPDVRNKKQKKE